MLSIISFSILFMLFCFGSGIVAIVYGIVTRTWQYLFLAPISMYCSCEIIIALNNEILKAIA